MAAGSDVIREFLVQLGFKIDRPTEQRFVHHIKRTTLAVAGLAAGAEASAVAVIGATAKMAKGLENLYFTSQRTKASASNLLSFGFAAENMGSSVEGMTGSIESLAKFIRSNPGALGLISSIGVRTHDANGHVRDTADMMQAIVKHLRQMPQYRAIAYANVLGIDYKTLLAMERGIGKFSTRYQGMLRAAGLNAGNAAKSAHAFMVQLRTLKAAGSILLMKVGADLSKALAPQLKRFRNALVTHMPEISAVIEKVAKWVVKLASDITTLALSGITFIDWLKQEFDSLPASSKKVVVAIGLIGAALWALSANPVLAIASAILLLWQDYEVWKHGGKSLIDWAAWKPDIDAAIHAIKELVGWISNLIDKFEKWNDRFQKSKPGKRLGHYIAATMAAMGDKTAQGAIDRTARYEKNANATRGIRNNNPGNINIKGSPGVAKWLGATGEDSGGFAIFPTAMAGIRAQIMLLKSYGKKRRSLFGSSQWDTPAKIIGHWSPPTGKGNSAASTKAYIDSVAKALHVGVNQRLNMQDPATLAKLAQAMATVENGKNPYATAMYQAAAGVPGAVARPVTVTQTVTNHFNGPVTDPGRVAHAVKGAMDDSNGRVVRNLRTVTQ